MYSVACRIVSCGAPRSSPRFNAYRHPRGINGHKLSRNSLRRIEKIDTLRPQQQAVLLKTIDTFLRGAAK